MIKVQFLGTGTSQGIPVIGSDDPVNFSTDFKDKRLRSSVLLSKNGQNITIDCGPDFRWQMLKAKVMSLEGILFTHEHNDHVLGIDDTRPFIHMSQKPMNVFGSERTLKEIRQRFPYVFSTNRYPGAPVLEEHIIDEQAFHFAGFDIETLAVMHGQLPINGYLIDQKFAYITDASFLPDATIEKVQSVDVLVLNALRKSPKHPSHFTLDEALSVIEKINPQKAYLTHISLSLGFHEIVQSELPAGIFLAYDGLEIEI